MPELLYDVLPSEAVRSMHGLAILQAIIAGELPQPPICGCLGAALVEAGPGRAVFQAVPRRGVYNSLGSVHGGWASTLLDFALGFAVFSRVGGPVRLKASGQEDDER